MMIGDVFGDIHYKGFGVFIAGGAGITPFISIFKSLQRDNKLGANKLVYANTTEADIIERDFLESILRDNFINILSKEKVAGMKHGLISTELLQECMISAHTWFYLCGPPSMMNAVLAQLTVMGVQNERIVYDAF